MDDRLGCSTVSFRYLPLEQALEQITRLGFGEIDLAALPGVCEHVPVPLTSEDVAPLAERVRASGLRVRGLNVDPGPLNDPNAVVADLEPFAELAAAVGARALLLPAGGLDREPAIDEATDLGCLAERLRRISARCAESGVDVLVEAPHHHRLVHGLSRTASLASALERTNVGMVLDTSHVVAGDARVTDAATVMGGLLRHVHLRDAVSGDINRSIGNGDVDFPAALDDLTRRGYQGHFSLELETHDISDAQRPEETHRAGRWITGLLQ